MGYTPTTIYGQSFEDFVSSIELCYATKGTSYYNKIAGAVKCSNIELLKLDLIVYLLNKYDNSSSLDCIFSGQTMAGIIYSGSVTPTDTTTHLEVYADFVTRLCKDCIVSDPPAAVTPAATTYYLFGEDGTTEITLESGGHINLQ
jgi:hypothetical protein